MPVYTHLKRFAITSILMMLVFVPIYGKNNPTEKYRVGLKDSVEQIIQDIRRIQTEQEVLDMKIDALEQLIDSSSSVIANEFSASNRVLTVSALVIAVIAILLGLFVAWIQNKVSKMSDTVKALTLSVEGKKKEVEDLVTEINTNFDSLFKRIRRADTLEYLKRLEAVPQDVTNIMEILLARELEPDDFQYLQRAYIKLVDIGEEDGGQNLYGQDYGSRYRLLLFQHFCGHSIEDPFLRDRMVADLDRLVSCCFDNDIRKSLSDVALVLEKRDGTFDRLDVLIKLLSALKRSKFGTDADILNILKNGIADKQLWKAANVSIEEPLDGETIATKEQGENA